MSKKTATLLSITAQATQREQALCLLAAESGEYDAMTDEEWVRLCEKTAHEAELATAGASSSAM